MKRKPPKRAKQDAGRGAPHLRLRAGFVLIAMVLSVFAARLVQLQGFDPHAYAAAAHKANLVKVVLPAKRGDILDRNGQPLADSVAGEMIIADPKLTTPHAAQIAKYLSNKVGVDYFDALKALTKPGKRFAYVARRIPSTIATEAVDHLMSSTKDGGLGLEGLTMREDPVREYPAGDVAANLVGFTGLDKSATGGLESSFNKTLSGKDGHETYEVGGGTRIPLGASSDVQPRNGTTITTTIDSDLQWYAQHALAQAVTASGASSGVATVMDVRTGEVLTFADYPTFDANHPLASPQADLGSRGLNDVYEPGSVEKVLTLSADIDAGHVTDQTQEVVPDTLQVQDRVIHDWFTHPTMHWTLAGVIAQSSNIGTVLAANKFAPGELRNYLTQFGLGQRTGTGLAESPGILPTMAQWTEGIGARISFGQSVSVNSMQMLAAVNTVANGGVYVAPSLIRGSAANNAGQVVGTDQATTRRVISQDAATQMMEMMERVVDKNTGTASAAQVPGYRVAGKTGTAQEVSPKCGCYDGSLDVSFAGFAPADDPRFTVYVVIKDPQTNKGGGSNAGPVFSKIMTEALRRYGVPPTGTKPSNLPVTWVGQKAVR